MKAKFALITGIVTLAAGLPLAVGADVKSNWEEHCAKCHGATGKADTKMGQKLKLKDYSDPKVQATLSDAAMLKATVEGVIIDGKEKMPGYASKLSADEAKALVVLIRSFRQ